MIGEISVELRNQYVLKSIYALLIFVFASKSAKLTPPLC